MRVRSDHVSILVTLVLAAGIAAGIAVNAGTGWDFADFYDAAHKAAAGQIRDLYNADAAIEGRPAEAQLPFWGTPLSAYMLAPLAWMRPVAALVVFKIENTL